MERALDVATVAELSQLANALARARGDKSQVNLAVNADKAGVVVVTAEKRRELQAKLKAIQDSDDSPASITLPAPQTQLQGNADAGNAPSDAPTIAAQTTTSPSMTALGYDLSLPESPSLRAFLEAKPVREEPRSRNSVGW